MDAGLLKQTRAVSKAGWLWIEQIGKRMSLMFRGMVLILLSLVAVAAAPAMAQEPVTSEGVIPQPVLFGCPMHPDVQSKVAGKCPKCNMTLVPVDQIGGSSAEDGFYTCPMHPEIQSAQPGTCPKCKMKLIKAAPPESTDYVVKLETTPRLFKAGQPVQLRFSIFHPSTEKLVKEFGILHDMPFHLFVVSLDFEHFEHIHPKQQPDGSFVIDTVLPRAGVYKVFCDFFPLGGTPQVIQTNLITAGFTGDLLSSKARLVPDKTFTKSLENTRFELSFEPARMVAGKPAELKYHLVDLTKDAPVTDLKPYLGAWGHTLILSEDGSDYLHSHPASMIPEDVDRATLVGPSDVAFETFFPHPGHYRIWSQFQRGEKVITVSFTVYVPRLQ
ncbi:MAG: heavy metal-binding domain-containing protein [Acidobacteriota bacterium]